MAPRRHPGLGHPNFDVEFRIRFRDVDVAIDCHFCNWAYRYRTGTRGTGAAIALRSRRTTCNVAVWTRWYPAFLVTDVLNQGLW